MHDDKLRVHCIKILSLTFNNFARLLCHCVIRTSSMEAQETSSLWFFTVEETEKNPCAVDEHFLNVNKSIDNLNVEQNV